jgi:hypothetical protein
LYFNIKHTCNLLSIESFQLLAFSHFYKRQSFEVRKESGLQFCEEEGSDESNPAIAIIVKIEKKLKDTHKLRIVD